MATANRRYGQALLDKAVNLCGSRRELRQRTDFSESYLSMVATGERRIAPLAAARIAAAVGLDAREAMTTAAIDGAKTQRDRAALEQTFAKREDGSTTE